MSRKITVTVVIVFVGGGTWFTVKHYRCASRNAALSRQIENIERDAHNRLKVGTGKADVSRFFAEHRIPFEFVESEAIGTLQTSGCAPLGCGTDSAIIGVRVKLDGTGAVAQEPKVVGMYTDCL